MMVGFSPTFQSFFVRTRNVHKTFNFLLIGFKLILSSQVFLLGMTMGGKICLRNKETQQTLPFIENKQYDASFSANDINSWKRYVCVKFSRFDVITDYVIILVCA